ncbi:hypothetical protein [Dyadobacter psychrotolerans]|uniref:Uncharacterized protein n=1 Tax=Dyadobacter psychrotolerans TaxID=2541721 RepID=A0A4R5E1W3_9BACT|nr:hypothetical protein [Dyadobacter psychrotolerans]TDE18125.1 hypothetical protein E0F88_00830 [Dyadobacter psychrotolerans]
MENSNSNTAKGKWFKGLSSISMVFLLAVSISCGTKDKEEEKTGETTMNDATDVKEDNSKVAEYVTFIGNDQNKMALDHAYTNEALLKLTSAVDAMASEVNFDIKADLDKARQCANKITENPFETSHADEIRKAAEILSGSLQNMQVAKYPGLSNEAEEVKSAAMAIDPKTLTLDQKDAVKAFFAKCSDLLEKMN